MLNQATLKKRNKGSKNQTEAEFVYTSLFGLFLSCLHCCHSGYMNTFQSENPHRQLLEARFSGMEAPISPQRCTFRTKMSTSLGTAIVNGISNSCSFPVMTSQASAVKKANWK